MVVPKSYPAMLHIVWNRHDSCGGGSLNALGSYLSLGLEDMSHLTGHTANYP